MEVDIFFEELVQLEQGLLRVGSLSRPRVIKANVQIMKEGIKIAKSLAPKDEFKLTNNIRLMSQVYDFGATMGTDLVYSWMKEEGGTITAKRAKWLVFQTKDGNWVRVKQVTQTGHFFMRDAAVQMEAIAEREYNKIADEMIRQLGA